MNGSHIAEVKAVVDAAVDALHSSLRELNQEVSGSATESDSMD